MNLSSPVTGDRSDEPAVATRSRDAAHTRQQLLEAGRRRFAFDGYSATTVRDIATDVGVNVALINRYFVSKEGLFEACIRSVGEELADADRGAVSIEEVVNSVVRRLAGPSTGDQPTQLQLMLMLRSSGDERAEEIRLGIIGSYAERIAAIAGWSPAAVDSRQLLLRAQIALSTILGIVLLRSSSGLEPLSSADEALLGQPLADLFSALLSPPE